VSGSQPVITRRGTLQRFVSPMVIVCLLLLTGGMTGLWFLFGSSGTADYDPIETRPALPHRIARPPEPEIAATPVVANPYLPHRFEMPVETPVAQQQMQAAAAPPANNGPMVTHHTSTPRADSPRSGAPGVTASRYGVNYKQTAIDGEEATVISDLGRTLKPTTRVPCTLTQAIDGTHAGPLVCVIARPVLAWDNTTVLLPKDTPVMGNYQPLSVGQGRMMAIAAHAYRSDGLTVPLGGAPMTDELGRVGMNGYVDNRLWERIGNAILTDAAMAAISLPQTALRSQSNGIQFNASDTQGVVNQVLSSTANLPPIFHKNQGEEIMILITAPVHLGALRYEVTR